MFYSQWIYFFIILGLINYSDQFNLRNNHPRRHTREALLKSNAQDILNKVINDGGQLGDKIKQAIQQDEDTVKKITNNILVAASQIAEAGATDIKSADQWTEIQGQIREGLNLIMNAYERFITFNRQACDSIENLAKSISSKYENELSILDRLSPPTDSKDTSTPDWSAFFGKFANLMNYTNVQQGLLPTAIDSIGDLTKRTVDNHVAVMGPTTQTITIHIMQSQPNSVSTQPQDDSTLTLPCRGISDYNGYQACLAAVAETTQTAATDACVDCLQN